MPKNALFIGRFQPFHLGHLSAVKQALATCDYLFIGIGSAETNFRPANPFTAGERFEMVQAALDEAAIPREKYAIIPIRNIDNYALWVKHVELYLPPFQIIHTGSPVVKTLYENENKQRKTPYQIIESKKELPISSSQVRAAILANQDWQSLLPNAVTQLLTTWNCVERLQAIQEADK